MNMLVLDTSFRLLEVIDFYKSIIWTDRYNEYGDFEIFCKMNSELLSIFKDDYYLWNAESNHLMIIESSEIDTSSEEGNTFTVKGRSLESILDRRIIWTPKHYTGSLQNAIESMLNESIIKPSISQRKIPNFVFKKSNDPRITKLTIDSEYNGDNLYSIISKECKKNDIGFRIIWDDKTNNFVFELYDGIDHSYNQSTTPYVVFSPNFENIINSNFYKSKEEYKNVTLVIGDDTNGDRKAITIGNVSGLERREIFTDARDVSSRIDGVEISSDEFNAILKNRGYENLSENNVKSAFEGKTDTLNTFKYREDFNLGDIVQINNEYDYGGASRITEIVMSEDEEGFSAYPTFVMLDQKE